MQNPNGFDIVLTSDCAGLNKLNHQIESYDPTTGKVAIWVSLPTVSHTADTTFADTTFYIYYGSANFQSTAENPTAVWDSNFQAVWHLNGTPARSAADSTANTWNGTIDGATAAPGQIAGAASFSGSGQYIDIGDLATRAKAPSPCGSMQRRAPTAPILSAPTP